MDAREVAQRLGEVPAGARVAGGPGDAAAALGPIHIEAPPSAVDAVFCPSFKTKATRYSSVRSASGSPSTAIKPANFAHLQVDHPVCPTQRSAAFTVAA